MSGFALVAIKELYHELRLSPPEVRQKHADRLEELLLSLDPERPYPYEFIYFRMTGFRTDTEGGQVLRGETLLADLHLLLERLSEAAPTPVESVPERVYTVGEVAGRFNVTVRTVYRWRREGLVARKYVFPDGRTRVGIHQSAVERFKELHGERVERSRQFSRIDEEEQQLILKKVARYRREKDLSLTEAAERTAQQVGRSRESIRQLLQRHGEDHPESGLLAPGPGRIDEDTRVRIFKEYRQGADAGELANRYDRARSSIYRIINQQRGRELLEIPTEHICEEAFSEPEFEQEELGSHWRVLAERLEAGQPWQAGGPPLNRQEEQLLFRVYNYTRHLLARGQGELNPRRYVSGRLVDRLEKLAERASRVRQALFNAYLPLVERVARQHEGSAMDREQLQDVGRRTLGAAIDSYDYRGAGRFGPYLKLDLQKRFARVSAGSNGSV